MSSFTATLQLQSSMTTKSPPPPKKKYLNEKIFNLKFFKIAKIYTKKKNKKKCARNLLFRETTIENILVHSSSDKSVNLLRTPSLKIGHSHLKLYIHSPLFDIINSYDIGRVH